MVKSDIFNAKNLCRTLSEGCHILALIFSGVPVREDGSLVLDECLSSGVLSLDDLLRGADQTTPEILVVCSARAQQVTRILKPRFEPRAVVEFSLIERHEQLSEKYFQIRAVEQFLVKLVQFFYEGDSLQESFHKATSETRIFTIQSSRKRVTCETDFENVVGSFSLHLQEQDKDLYCESGEGTFHNMTEKRPKKNFQPQEIQFIGQKDVLMQIIEAVKTRDPKQHLNVFGSEKAEKGRFAVELASFFWQRCIFKNGVFLLDCRNYTINKLREFLESQLGFNINEFLRDGPPL
jgi:hypothetical protein